jgi:hypothetical protein
MHVSLSRRYYGLSVWFPDVIKHLQSDEYALLTRIVQSDKYANFSINFTMENQIHTGMEYDNGRSEIFVITPFASYAQNRCLSVFTALKAKVLLF